MPSGLIGSVWPPVVIQTAHGPEVQYSNLGENENFPKHYKNYRYLRCDNSSIQELIRR